MLKIKFELFNDGVDIIIGDNIFSLSSYSQLWNQKNSKKFRKYVRENPEKVSIDNYCTSYPDFWNFYLLDWLEN